MPYADEGSDTFLKCIYLIISCRKRQKKITAHFSCWNSLGRVLAFIKKCDGVRVVFFFQLSVVQLLGNLWWCFAESFCEETDSQLYENLCWMIWTSRITFHCLLSPDCPFHLIVSANPVYHLWLDWLHWANFYWTTHKFTNYLLGSGSHSILGFVGDSGVDWSCLLQWKQSFYVKPGNTGS